jgi:hypothetical protein
MRITTGFTKLLVVTGVCGGLMTGAAIAQPADPPGERPATITPSPAVAEALADMDAIVTELAAVRGLTPQGPVNAQARNREDVRAHLVELIEREYRPEEIAGDEATMRFLRILQPEQSLVELTLQLLQSQVSGYYDQDADVFYLIDDSDESTVRMVAAHELFHAIQDQLWDLRVVQGPHVKLTDVGLARQSLIEGDATHAMFLFLAGGEPNQMIMDLAMRAMETERPAMDVEIPDLMWRQLIAPYVRGLEFVSAVQQAGGWEAVNATYEDPPQSTEQILHPERYLERDEPVWLDWALEERSALELVDEDIVGELTLVEWMRGLMSGTVSTSAMERAGEGWDGDRWRLYRDPEGRELGVWLFEMDSEEDALALGTVLARTGGVLGGADAAPVAPRGADDASWEGESALATLRVGQRGERVLWTMSRATAGADAMTEREVRTWMEQVWGRASAGPYPE